MELVYKRDLEHNYMVISCAGLKNENMYAENIFKAHKMKNLLSFERRYINSDCNLYYKTDSMVSLYNKSLVGKLGVADLKRLFQDLFELQGGLKEYLLDTAVIFLSVDTVYFDLDKESFRFTAFPYEHQDKGNLKHFTEELLDIINTDDDAAVTLAYSLCEYSERKDFRLKDIRSLLDKYGTDPECGYEEKSVLDNTADPYREIDNRISISDTEGYADFFVEEKENADEKKLKLIPLLICMILLSASIYIRNEYMPSGLLSIICHAVMGAGLLG